MKISRLLSAGLLLGTALAASAENWPQWRGPTGMGISQETDLPTHWTKENIQWRTPLPGPGNSTPVVWESRVFLTQARDRAGHERTLMCFDRDSGKVLWQKGVTFTGDESSHQTNPQCSASPVTDGERVIVSFASAGVSCYDLEGKELWHRDLGPQEHIWGNGGSPVIHGDLCLLNFGPGPRTFLIAMNKRTGETVWQNDEPGGRSGNDSQPGEPQRNVWLGSWTTPVAIDRDGTDAMLMCFPGRFFAFDPTTGKEFWNCRGLNPLIYTSPIAADGIAVAMGGFRGDTIAVKLGGSGEITETHRLWRNERTQQRIGSGVIHEGRIYILNDPGIAQCVDLKTGKEVWAERMRGKGATAQNWSSLVLSEDKLFAVNQGGDAFVFRASPKFEPISTYAFGEKVIGSMAVSQGRIFVRSHEALYCIAK